MNRNYYYKAISLVLFLSLIAFFCGRNNASWYSNFIGEIIQIETSVDTERMELSYTKDTLYIQEIDLKILNGEYKGDIVHVTNRYSQTTAIEEHYRLFDQVFLELVSKERVHIVSLKRDWILLTTLTAFIGLVIIIGKRKGSMALLSMLLNILIILLALPYLIRHDNLILLGIICATIFTIVSFLCIHGWSKQCAAGLLGTAASSLISILLAYLVIANIHYNGLDYDQMEYLTTISPKDIFLLEIILGGLGAIIDISNTMNAVVRELCIQNPTIQLKELWHSGMEIGKDIMGTMINVLFFVFLAGSIPQVVLWISNAVNVGEILQYLLSLELARALIGGISVVISIPVSLFIAILIQKGEWRWQ